jgi:hypothetical protein
VPIRHVTPIRMLDSSAPTPPCDAVGPAWSNRRSSAEAYELTFRARPKRLQSCVEFVSPIFAASGSESVWMPFAVTPFGPMTLATVWALHPDLKFGDKEA